MDRLFALGRPDANGILYADVGVAAAGVVVMAMMHARLDSDRTWQLFGVLSLLTTLALWRAFRGSDGMPAQASGTAPSHIYWNADKRRMMGCYGALGFGYIIPATFLPDMAHRYITDPLVFGLAWPVFGAASALSTWIAARWLARVNDRKLWAIYYLLMMIGVALPALWPTLTAILIAALLVGGTYMVATMLGLRKARRAGGTEATPFIAVMTAAFAIGQIVDPLLVSSVAHLSHGFVAALIVAAVVLLASAYSLWHSAALDAAD